MSSPNSIATAILANTAGQSRNDYYGGGLDIESPLTGRSFLSVSIGNTTTESMASSIVSPRTRGRWDRRISDVESSGSMYSPTTAAAAAAAPAPAPPSSSWLTDDDDEEASVRSSGGLDTRPFPSFGPSFSSIAPDSSFYSQIARFQGVRNSVSLAQPWRRRKESTTTGSYTTSTDDSDDEDEDDDASTISGSRHEGQRQRQHAQEEQEGQDTAAVDLFSQHQFIMPKPDETTPLIAADEENNLGYSSVDARDDPPLTALRNHRSHRLFLRRLILACLAGILVASVLLVVVVTMRPPPPASSEGTQEE